MIILYICHLTNHLIFFLSTWSVSSQDLCVFFKLYWLYKAGKSKWFPHSPTKTAESQNTCTTDLLPHLFPQCTPIVFHYASVWQRLPWTCLDTTQDHSRLLQGRTYAFVFDYIHPRKPYILHIITDNIEDFILSIFLFYKTLQFKIFDNDKWWFHQFVGSVVVRDRTLTYP